MSHINYNHLYYFWHVYKEGSVVGRARSTCTAHTTKELA